MIFSDSPQQRALERMMTAVPRFLPKGGGIMVLHHFEYTVEMCNCRYCPYYRGKRKCTASQCPCIEERIVAGAASRAEVMAETMRDIHNAAFRRRLPKLPPAAWRCFSPSTPSSSKRGGCGEHQMQLHKDHYGEQGGNAHNCEIPQAPKPHVSGSLEVLRIDIVRHSIPPIVGYSP